MLLGVVAEPFITYIGRGWKNLRATLNTPPPAFFRKCGFSPSTLVFGAQAAGTSSAPQTVGLTNSGNAVLNIQTVAVGGSRDFVIGSGTTCTNGSSVAINGSCVIQVIFTSATSGQKSATLTITDNAPGSPQQISLAGTSSSAALSFSPTSVSFPAQFVGTSGLPQTLVVTNTGNVTLTITAVTSSAADFGVLSNCTNPVAPGSNCTRGVFFSPTAGGPDRDAEDHG